jgi:DNA-binding GntR family transcriptional regulator
MGNAMTRVVSARPDVRNIANDPQVQVRRATFRMQVAEHLRLSIIRGELPPGSQVTEAGLALRYGVSRGPLREAMSQLIGEGLIVSVPYTGTRVVSLSTADVREIFSLRTTLETLAFEQAWDRRDPAFAHEIELRHRALLGSLRKSDHYVSSLAEIHLHSLIYEASGHKLLLETWQRIAKRLQLYLAVHQRAHGRTGPKKDAHEAYVKLAQGKRLDLMIAEVEHHMRRGVEQLEHYLASL